MREFIVPALILLLLPPASAQNPASWQVVKDSKNACRIAVPPDWVLLPAGTGAAVLQDATNAIAVVTSQPGQDFRPLSEPLQKTLGIRKQAMFENTPKRVFYQDKTSKNSDDPNAYSASVPARNGTCSCRVSFLPGVPSEIAKKIVLSLGPAPE